MKVKEALDRINFSVGNLDDITGKAVNPIISNYHVILQLNSQLRQYANKTKGIQDVYSLSLTKESPVVQAPTLALRSQGYYYCFVISAGAIYPMDMRGQSDVFPVFRFNPINGITNWIMPWGAGKEQYLTFYPSNSITYLSTTLSADMTPSSTTITVASTAGFVATFGRITIGTEKIVYEYKDTTHFYGCIRASEMTTAAAHLASASVLENNIWLFYSRLNSPIVITDNNFITEAVLNQEIEVVEEHMEGIIKAVAYNLIIKLDPERASFYKVDTDALYAQYENDIAKGYYKGRQGTNIREPYASETGMPYASNLMF
jgi:hypothetical protein